MISFKEAYQLVLDHSQNYGQEKVPLKEAKGRVLAKDILADRDFPPYDRSTKDGIAINFDAIEKGRNAFEIAGILAAGNPPSHLQDKDTCMEIMTGAVVPYDADTVVMYEDVVIEHGIAKILTSPKKGQNIHKRGSDEQKGALVLEKNTETSAAEIGVLAAVGKAIVTVKKLPSISVISTGKELVEVNQMPLPHQIRKSNAYSLFAALSEEGITPLLLHLYDDKDIIRQKLSFAIQEMDVLLLSGGVSKGKYDFIPEVMDELGVEKVFHRVLQRPGKPFWFGIHKKSKTIIFSFPGNPASTFANYHIYFKDWLRHSLGLSIPKIYVVLNEDIEIKGGLTQFLRANTKWESGTLSASLVTGNGSGDLTSLAKTDGFIRLDPREQSYKKGENVSFIPTRRLL